VWLPGSVTNSVGFRTPIARLNSGAKRFLRPFVTEPKNSELALSNAARFNHPSLA